MSAPRDIINEAISFGLDTAPGRAVRALEALAEAGYVLVQRPPGVDRVVVEWTRQPCARCDGLGQYAEGSVQDEFVLDCHVCDGSGRGPTGVALRALEAVELHWNGIEQAIDIYGDVGSEQYDASMPLFSLVDLPVAEKPTP